MGYSAAPILFCLESLRSGAANTRWDDATCFGARARRSHFQGGFKLTNGLRRQVAAEHGYANLRVNNAGTGKPMFLTGVALGVLIGAPLGFFLSRLLLMSGTSEID